MSSMSLTNSNKIISSTSASRVAPDVKKKGGPRGRICVILSNLLSVQSFPEQNFWFSEDSLHSCLIDSCKIDNRILLNDVVKAMRKLARQGTWNYRQFRKTNYYCHYMRTKTIPQDAPDILIPKVVPPFLSQNQRQCNSLTNELKFFEKDIATSTNDTNNTQLNLNKGSNLPINFENTAPDGYRIQNINEFGKVIKWSFDHCKNCSSKNKDQNIMLKKYEKKAMQALIIFLAQVVVNHANT